jgi:hypothetical protein
VEPEIFPTLFAYIKRPAVYPLLWSWEKGFDFAAYNKLMAEADFFGLDNLKDWIQQKKYLEVVETRLKLQIHPGSLRDYDFEENSTFIRHAHNSAAEDVELISCIEAKISSGKQTTSIVTVVKHTDYRPERCMKSCTNPEKK